MILTTQDPFGNYVVQYVLDLGDARFSDALIKRFIGSVCLFSAQKFSSNVIEKVWKTQHLYQSNDADKALVS